MTETETRVLIYLRRHGPATPDAVMTDLGIGPLVAGLVLGGLMRQGLVTYDNAGFWAAVAE